MSRTLSANFQTYAALKTLQPVVVMSVSGITRRYSSQTFANITANDKRLIRLFEADILDIDHLSAKSRQGAFRTSILNENLDVSQELIIDNELHETDIIYSIGFQELNDSDFVDLQAVTAGRIQHANEEEVSFITTDARRLISDRQYLFDFQQSTNLDGDHADTDTTITVDSTTGFVDFTNVPQEVELLVPAIIVGNREIIAYGGANGATTFTSAGRTSGYTGTPNIDHSDNEEVRQAVMLAVSPGATAAPNGPIVSLLPLLMTRKAGSFTSTHDYYDYGNYDANFRGMGLGLTSSQINILSFERMDGIIRDYCLDKSTEYTGRFAIGFEKQPAETWISNYLRGFGCFLYLDSDGKLAIKSWDRIELTFNEINVSTLTEDDILENSEFELDYENIINHFEIAYQRNWLEGSYSTRRTFQHDDSKVTYGLSQKPYIIEVDCFDSDVGDTEVKQFLTKFAYTHSDPPAMFKLYTYISDLDIAPGDVITVNENRRFIDYSGATAVQGWSSKRCLVLGQRIVLDGENAIIELRGFSWQVIDKSEISTNILEQVFDGGDWDDSTIAIGNSTSNTTTTESQDAYIDATSVENNRLWRLEITITPPASPTNPDTVILFNIGFHLQDVVATDDFSAIYRNIRYNTDDDAFNMVFHFSDLSPVQFPTARIKVDAFDPRETDGTNANAGDLASISIVDVRGYIDNPLTFTELST